MARDIEVIRRDIGVTRERLRDTAEAIGWKADVPARARDILRETVGVVRERVSSGEGHSSAGAHGGGPSLIDRARSVVSGVTDSVGGATSTVGDKVGSATSTVGDAVGSATSSVGSAASSVGSTASSVGEGARSAGSSVSDGAGSASSAVSHATDVAKERLPSASDAREGVRRAVSVARANPTALALGALALGAAAGLMLPSTKVEDEKIGPVADDLREKGVEKAGEAVQQGREVVEERAHEVAEAVRS
jgi:hypothetical protein